MASGSSHYGVHSVTAAFVFCLKVEVQQLSAELQNYNQLKTRVQESTFKKDLQRNIQVLPPGGQAGQITSRTTPTTFCCFTL